MASTLDELLEDVPKHQADRIRNGVSQGIISFDLDAERVRFPIQDKDYEFVGERIVIAALFSELVLEQYGYNYPPENIGFERTPPRREPPEPADIVIYESDEQEHAFAVVEAEATAAIAKLDEAKREGLGKANNFRADWMITACGEDIRYYSLSPAPASDDNIEDYRKPSFPPRYGEPIEYQYGPGDGFLDLETVDMKELQRRFKSCHDKIWEGGKLDPAQAFDEMSKLIFAKIEDEIHTPVEEHYDFQVGQNEEAEVVAQRVRDRYKEATEDEAEIFEDEIEASDSVIYSVVQILQDISLDETDLDAKGQAFEAFLGRMFKGEYGQYFTPRQIVQFMIGVINPDHRDSLIDPACGSGGFLLYAMEHVQEALEEAYGDDSRKDRIFRQFMRGKLHGVEINERIARIAMMNMVLHGDGHSNIDGGKDGLDDFDTFTPSIGIDESDFDVVLANPPFGSKIDGDSADYFTDYELTEKKSGGHRSEEKVEIMFIERCLELMDEDDGSVGIVLPNGILNNRSWKYENTRKHMLNQAHVDAVIELPDFTFRPYDSNIKPSLVFLSAQDDDEPEDYPVFMSVCDKIGYDSVGEEDENNLPEVLEQYREFETNPEAFEDTERCFTVSSEKLQRRMDATYFRNKKFVEPPLDEHHSQFKDMATISRSQTKPADEPEKVFNFVGLEDVDETEGRIAKVNQVRGMEKKSRHVVFEAGDLILARIEPSVLNGNVAIVPDDYDEYVGSSELVVVNPKEGVNKQYLFWLLRSPYFIEQARDRLTGTTGRQRLNKDYLKEMVFPDPSLETQKKIGERYAEMREEKRRILKKANDIENNMHSEAYDMLEGGRLSVER